MQDGNGVEPKFTQCVHSGAECRRKVASPQNRDARFTFLKYHAVFDQSVLYIVRREHVHCLLTVLLESGIDGPYLSLHFRAPQSTNQLSKLLKWMTGGVTTIGRRTCDQAVVGSIPGRAAISLLRSTQSSIPPRY